MTSQAPRCRPATAPQEGDCDKLRELLDGGGASVVNERTVDTNKVTG
eukprot:COSAG06_NODE_56615_length_283_cov_80.027174_1_plen_46_part_01